MVGLSLMSFSPFLGKVVFAYLDRVETQTLGPTFFVVMFIFMFLVQLIEMLGFTGTLLTYYSEKEKFYRSLQQPSVENNFPFSVYAFFLYQLIAAASLLVFAWAGGPWLIMTLYFIYPLKITFYLLIIVSQPIRESIVGILKRLGKAESSVESTALSIATYLNCFLIMTFAAFILRGLLDMTPIHLLWMVPLLTLILAPLQFPFLYAQSLRVKTSEDRLSFLFAIVWIGFSASLQLYRLLQ